MNLRQIFILLCLLVSFTVKATQYRVLSLEKQVEEADVFVSGVVTAIDPFEKEGRIWSKVTLTLKSSLNYQSPQIVFIMPGGSLNGKSMKIESVDVPALGDYKNYLLKKHQETFVLSNLGLGEYVREEIQGREYFTSKIFSEIPRLKKLTFEDFRKASGGKEWKFASFEVPLKVENKTLTKPDSERTLPMLEDKSYIEKKKKEANVFRFILWIIGFSLLGVIIFTMKKRTHGDDK